MKKRFTDEQIIGFLKQAAAGAPIKDLCRKHGFSDASFYLWRRKFGGMDVPDAKRLKSLEAENAKLKKMLAEAMLDIEGLKVVAKENSRPAGTTQRRHGHAGQGPDVGTAGMSPAGALAQRSALRFAAERGRASGALGGVGRRASTFWLPSPAHPRRA